jgi:hypothetical protein
VWLRRFECLDDAIDNFETFCTEYREPGPIQVFRH